MEKKNIIKGQKSVKNYRFREVSDINKQRFFKEGWVIASNEEKKKHGNKRYMGTNVELMKKEVE